MLKCLYKNCLLKKYAIYVKIITVYAAKKNMLQKGVSLMIVTDNSLCNIDFSKKVTEQNIHEYIVSLFESGIDLAEIDYRSYKYLKDISTSNRFVFRVDAPADLAYIRNKEFYYTVVPYELLHVAVSFQKAKYLVEIDGEAYNTDGLIKICRRISNTDFEGAVRIVKNFDSNTNELSEFIERYYDEFTLPLDICPLNSRLTGLDAAYKAFEKGVNMITMGFSASCFYTPYELFVMYFPDCFKIHPQAVLIPFLLVCAARYNFITDDANKGLYNIVNVLDTYKKPTVNIDSIFDQKPFVKRLGRKTENPFDVFSAAQNSFFSEFDFNVNYDACKTLSEVLDNSDLILYNRFFDKSGFKS